MSDRSWMIDPLAVRAAKECIQIVKDELDVKLLLSNPDFLHLLGEYVELTESTNLQEAYQRLLAFAGNEKSSSDLNAKAEKVTIFKQAGSAKQTGSAPQSAKTQTDEVITYAGKSYPRWRDGKEFSGVYRGQPTYR